MWCNVIGRQCPVNPCTYDDCEKYCIFDEVEEMSEDEEKDRAYEGQEDN